MTRPSTNTDRKLIEAGKALALRGGLAALSIRAVARRAGVNLGMFHYYFKTRDRFFEVLLQEVYEDFFGRLSAEAHAGGGPEERLRAVLRVFARAIRDRRTLIYSLLTDSLLGDPATLAFAARNVPRHAALVGEIIAEGQKAGVFKKVPLPTAQLFCLGSVGVPTVAVSLFERRKLKRPFGVPLEEAVELILSDEAIEQRLDLVLAGLSS